MSFKLARTVSSNQTTVHHKLEQRIRRHLSNPFAKPIAAHTQIAFDNIAPLLAQHKQHLLLDSGCGIGESTVWLANRFPDKFVIGVDKSSYRLHKAQQHHLANCVLVQADLTDFWRLCAAAGWCLQKHYILYPNPWPKAQHLQRRWHGSALFPTILQLGGYLEVRSNWAIYIEEFVLALQFAGYQSQLEPYLATPPITPFERKYQNSGQHLWRCRIQLN